MGKKYFYKREKINPQIYAYTDPAYPGWIKVGYTIRDVEKRVAEQYPTLRPRDGKPYKIILRESSIRPDGTSFTDHPVHKKLAQMGFKPKRANGGVTEWFKCSRDDILAAILAVKRREANAEQRTQDFKMRPEQAEAVKVTEKAFLQAKKERPLITPKFLWNAKMRFGKTFAAYQLAKKMKMKRILILTFKPAVKTAWKDDLLSHIDFEGWQFIEKDGELTYEDADIHRPIVCFGSFQDYLGVNENGGIKSKNEWVHLEEWDLVIFDEYHFGAWRENARKLFEAEDEDNFDAPDEKYNQGRADNLNEESLPITAKHYLYLSGTPFRALNTGEFIEDQVYNWTYADEQKAKEEWEKSGKPNNPYAALPRIVLMTYHVPPEITKIAQQGEFNEFDLNVFFSAQGTGEDAQFVYKNEVQKWLNLIRGAYMPTTTDDLKLGAGKSPVLPYSDARLLNILTHTLWFLPNVASCFAMRNLLRERQNSFYHDYKINVCAGTGAGIGAAALDPVLESMENPLQTKTITLSCGKLTTGVTVKPWSGIFMLRNLSSPETYFQAAFRVQSPWEYTDDNGERQILKKECYVFDFALNRALRQITDYSCRLNIKETSPETKVAEFISFLPVLAYDGSTMKEIDAAEILDASLSGTSATLLARRWQSALLVNVDNDALRRLMASSEAMNALEQIEGFRALNSDIETIINKSEKIQKVKREGKPLTPAKRRELTQEEKEFKSRRKKIQEKLIKLATRIPIFMYLTDYREQCLGDIIRKLEPELFKKVTGLEVQDFELLVNLDIFNASVMNDAIYKFKRYEDSSLTYMGIDRHADENIGLYDTVVSPEDYRRMGTR